MTSALTQSNYINALAYVCNLVITYVSMTGAFGPTNSELSKKYQTIVTPAGWAFSIWGLIFITEGIFAICQFLPKYRNSPYAVSRSVLISWVFTCIFQIFWTFAFAQEIIWLSAVLLASIWVSLGVLVQSQRALAADASITPLNPLDYFLLVSPFRIHFGWVTAATFVNINVCFVCYARTDSGLQLSAGIASLVALAFIAGYLNTNHVLSAVLSWAVGAIVSELNSPKESIQSLFASDVIRGVRGAAFCVSVALAVMTVVGVLADLFGFDTKRTSRGRTYVKPLL